MPGAGDRQDGFALLAVILFLLAVAAIVAPFALASRSSLDAAAAVLHRDRLHSLADGLVTATAARLAAAEDADALPLPRRSEPVSCRAGALTVTASIQDQRGLIDLNAADVPLLGAGLRTLGLGPADADAHARAMMAFRQPEAEAEAGGLGAAALVSGGLKHAAFEAVEEVHDFPALRPVALARLRRTFTVHSRQAAVARDRMPRALAAAVPARLTGTAAAGGAAAWRIEMSVRTADASLGHAGAVVAAGDAAGDAGTGDVRILERTAFPDAAAPPVSLPCAGLFGAGITAWLAGAEV